MRSLFGVDPENYNLLGYDFGMLENRIQAHYVWRYDTEEHPYCDSLLGDKDLGTDCHTITAKKIAAIIGREFKRDPAKSVAYCCAYGGSAKKVAQTVGVGLELGEIIHQSYWNIAKPLADLKEKLEQYWEKIGNKKFVLGLDGRKIPTRAKSALINALFQSAGVICAKRAMVIHERLLREHGLICDFWTDDWRSSVYAQQLIAMHFV